MTEKNNSCSTETVAESAACGSGACDKNGKCPISKMVPWLAAIVAALAVGFVLGNATSAPVPPNPAISEESTTDAGEGLANETHAAHQAFLIPDSFTPEQRAAATALLEVNQKMHSAMNVPLTGNTDRDFVAMMIPHHQGAIAMADVVLQYGSDVAVKALAQSIIAAQATEIQTMQALLLQFDAAAAPVTTLDAGGNANLGTSDAALTPATTPAPVNGGAAVTIGTVEEAPQTQTTVTTPAAAPAPVVAPSAAPATTSAPAPKASPKPAVVTPPAAPAPSVPAAPASGAGEPVREPAANLDSGSVLLDGLAPAPAATPTADLNAPVAPAATPETTPAPLGN